VEPPDIALSAARGTQLAASLSAFGVLLLWSAVLPPGVAGGRLGTRLRRLFHLSVVCALAGAVAWLLLESAQMTDAGSLAETLAALEPVLGETRFGHVLALRVVLLILAALLLGRGTSQSRRAAGAFGAALALVPHPWLTHAGATGGTEGVLLLGTETVHVLAAGAWAGSLAPLAIALDGLAPGEAFLAARRYSWLGLACVVLLAATALAQGWILIASLPALVGTDYGRVALLKAALFATMLAFAAANRFQHRPALASGNDAGAARRLRISVAIEATVGLAVVLAAGFLADLTPAVHG
jgi:putative copper resistance protein D